MADRVEIPDRERVEEAILTLVRACLSQGWDGLRLEASDIRLRGAGDVGDWTVRVSRAAPDARAYRDRGRE